MNATPQPQPQPLTSRPELPYSFGNPVPLGTRSCAMLWAASALGFAALLLVQSWMPGLIGAALATLLFVGLQWAGLRWAVGPAWVALFRRPRWSDVAIALVAVPFVMGLPALVALYGVGASHLSVNAGIDAISTLPPRK